MVAIKYKEMRIIEKAFQMEGGYVLGFSNRTFAEFFMDEFGIEIYDEKYRTGGTSKANMLRSFIRLENGYVVSKVIKKLWESTDLQEAYEDQNECIPTGQLLTSKSDNDIEAELLNLVDKIENRDAVPYTDIIEKFMPDETLDELVEAIERDIIAVSDMVYL